MNAEMVRINQIVHDQIDEGIMKMGRMEKHRRYENENPQRWQLQLCRPGMLNMGIWDLRQQGRIHGYRSRVRMGRSSDVKETKS